jgi:Holliday junction resolvasome RuvABC endonuclease subunit
MIINVVGFDPSLRNWGIACGTYDTVSKQILIPKVSVIQPEVTTSKQVRQNSKDLESAYQLTVGALAVVHDAQAVFIEVPIGSQSARAMASYGICVGVAGALRAANVPFFEQTPTEVKMRAVGRKTATKEDMIKWAMALHPEANWPMYSKNGVKMVSEAKAEHMADAIGAIYAGISSVPFQQLLQMMSTTTQKRA